ncbi:hypothetical protein [Acinetobacter nosocomialis]|uniref:hypothetical protein n=1 Tax=Acinetobacter nosocomialis TaxID=106654 RepID=UPI001C0DD95F|nr:hypothetical protein [Acinetobacter nosocomialis]MBU3138430.1 hypothetical protein [Acinetobacter nosocomialis]
MTDLNKEREAFEKLSEIAEILNEEKSHFNGDFYDLPFNSCAESFINGARYAWLEKAKAQAVPEKKIYLTCEQLYAAANFGAPNKDPELLETELTIAWFDEAHSGSGYYVYISEYPEEGAMKLDIESGVEG